MFNFYGALSARLERSKLVSVLKIILKPLIREMSTTDDTSMDIRQIAKSASSIVKKKCGPETYNENCTVIQQHLNARRALRKKTSLLQVCKLLYYLNLLCSLIQNKRNSYVFI